MAASSVDRCTELRIGTYVLPFVVALRSQRQANRTGRKPVQLTPHQRRKEQALARRVEVEHPPLRSVVTDHVEGSGSRNQQLGYTPVSMTPTLTRGRHPGDEVHALNVKRQVILLDDAEVTTKIHNLSQLDRRD